MGNLSSRRLIRASRKGNFPLLLRHLWRLRTTWDPLHQEQYAAAKHSVKLAFALWCVLVLVYAFSVEVFMVLVDGAMKNTAFLVLFACAPTLVIWRWYIETILGTRGVKVYRDVRINADLKRLLEWTSETLSGLSQFSEEKLRLLADNILLIDAVSQAKHADAEPKCQGSLLHKPWYEINGNLQKQFELKYETLRRLGLVQHPKDYYREQARAALDAESEDTKAA